MIKHFCSSLYFLHFLVSSILHHLNCLSLIFSLRLFLSQLFKYYINYRSYNGSVFGVKLQSRDTHLAKKLSSMHWHPILLYRSNIIRVVASFHYSRCTGCWDESSIHIMTLAWISFLILWQSKTLF